MIMTPLKMAICKYIVIIRLYGQNKRFRINSCLGVEGEMAYDYESDTTIGGFSQMMIQRPARLKF